MPRTILACNHIFHNTCISTWANNQNNCPLCRTTINPDLKEFSINSPSGEPQQDPNPYFTNIPEFLLRVLIRSPRAIPTLASAAPVLLFLDGEKPTFKNIPFVVGLCGCCSLISLIIWCGEKTKPWEKTVDEEILGYVRPNSKNYALINASIIINACIIKAVSYSAQQSPLEAIALGATCVALQHDAITHFLDREK